MVFDCGCDIRWIQLWQQRGEAGLHTQQLYCRNGASKIRLHNMYIHSCGKSREEKEDEQEVRRERVICIYKIRKLKSEVQAAAEGGREGGRRRKGGQHRKGEKVEGEKENGWQRETGNARERGKGLNVNWRKEKRREEPG